MGERRSGVWFGIRKGVRYCRYNEVGYSWEE